MNPVDYTHHPYASMKDFAGLLSLRHDCKRIMRAYYRGMRLIHEFHDCDPALITEPQMRVYFLFVRNVRQWKPQSIRQSVATAKVFFVEMLGHSDWKVFSQIKTKDHATLPAVLTRAEVIALLKQIRLRRYLIPLKLIYCCGLRLSECLGLTIHDIKGDDQKLYIRQSKNNKAAWSPSVSKRSKTSAATGQSTATRCSSSPTPETRQQRPRRRSSKHARRHPSHALQLPRSSYVIMLKRTL